LFSTLTEFQRGRVDRVLFIILKLHKQNIN
jgi:hypothetical protein